MKIPKIILGIFRKKKLFFITCFRRIFFYTFSIFARHLMDHSREKSPFETIASVLLLGSLLLSLQRIIGYFSFDIPYGYDPGFFRHAIQTAIAALPGLPPPPSPSLPYHEPLFGLLSIILTSIGYTPDMIIGPFLGGLSIFTAFCVYFLGNTSHSRLVGLLGASIFLLSIIQYQEYWWNYWRNIMGIIFMLVSLGLLVRRSPLAILTIAGLFTIHRPSALFFVVVIALTFLVRIIRERTIPTREILLILAGGLLALPLYADQIRFLTDMITPITTTIGGITASGTFFTSREFFFHIFPYFLLLIPGIFSKVEKREYDIVFIGFLVGLLWSVLRLFFYSRMMVFFDIFAILLAAYSMSLLLHTLKPRYAILLLIGFFGLQGYLATSYAYEQGKHHAISREEFDILRNLDILIPDTTATILSTHRYYTPWILGYSGKRTLAPGLLDDQIWDDATWRRFYFEADDATRCRMIADYRSLTDKLYIFV
jgi:hypothetical protein